MEQVPQVIIVAPPGPEVAPAGPAAGPGAAPPGAAPAAQPPQQQQQQQPQAPQQQQGVNNGIVVQGRDNKGQQNNFDNNQGANSGFGM